MSIVQLVNSHIDFYLRHSIADFTKNKKSSTESYTTTNKFGQQTENLYVDWFYVVPLLLKLAQGPPTFLADGSLPVYSLHYTSLLMIVSWRHNHKNAAGHYWMQTTKHMA